ncbi:hypothetical protein [Micromonospora sp. RP3T]|uniref:hypothetical protein n=1 Tax=Micromonospora sp. RP3T TaxID=2135446 RepID=UPI000D154B7D|nr:hypothetical protein [Micromonospora sp. RP3T]PTA46877.1 hypothetical protein C8054_07300 [Micromonospora sp. RP3T]
MIADWKQVTRLDLSGLVTWLRSTAPEHVRWTGNEWLGVLERLTAYLTDEVAGAPVPDWPALSAAYDVVLARARAAGGIDEREAVVRRLLVTAAAVDRAHRDPSIPLLDPRFALAGLAAVMPMSTPEAVEVAPRWRELAPDEMRRLLRAAGLVTAAGMLAPHLADADPGTRDLVAELETWERNVLTHLRSERPSA